MTSQSNHEIMGKKLTRFEIKGLFNQCDVDLNLEEPVNIFVGENGMGKTKIMNCFNYSLKGDFLNIKEIKFDKIIITFEDEEAVLNKEDMMAHLSSYDENIRRRPSVSKLIESIFPKAGLETLKNQNLENNSILEEYIIKISERTGFSLKRSRMELEDYLISNRGNIQNVFDFLKKIKDNFDGELLYLPTYRRIEEDVNVLLDFLNIKYPVSKYNDDYYSRALGETDISDALMKFGMDDVEKIIENYLTKIKENTRVEYAKMTAILMKQYLSDTMDDYLDIDEEKIDIALKRIGGEISDSVTIINDLINNEQIGDKRYSHLRNLLKNFVDSYEKYKMYDERIKKFSDVCNIYLRGKEFIYDESEIALDLKRTNKNGSSVKLKDLSSGEKQIVSLFSKLYLEEKKNYIILFDEPELSLSVPWQKVFLPDIMDSGVCSKLVAVTHSPFIFSKYAEDPETLKRCVKNIGDCIVERN